MTKDQIGIIPSFYQGYVSKVEELPLMEAFTLSMCKLEQLDITRWEPLHQQSYFPGKWTLNELLQHIIDTERIMSFRALSFARGESQPLPGYDENAYAAHSEANDRSIRQLHDEWLRLRCSTIDLFESFSNSALRRSGVANGCEMSVGALGFIIIGHEMHHWDIIEQLYLPLLT